MRILGLVGATHDSGIAILDDGAIDLVIEEERLKREKRTKNFPRQSLIAAFGADGRGLADIDVMVTPWDVRRLRRSFTRAVLGRLPGSLSLLSERSHTPQRNEIAILNHYLRRKLRRDFPDVKLPPLLNVGHHDAHAAAFFVSPFDKAAVLVMDGYGDDAATSVYGGSANRLERRWSSSFFNSIGMVYTFVTDYLGFDGLGDEGKVMALAAFGEPSYVARFRDVVQLQADGRYAINMEYFSFDIYGELRPFRQKFFDMFGPPRLAGEALTDRHRAIAFALQAVSEATIAHVARAALKAEGTKNLVFSGGVALNCVACARLFDTTDVEHVWVPPSASDTGAPLGATLWHHHQTNGQRRTFELRHAAYGLSYSDDDIDRALNAAGLECHRLNEEQVAERAARDIASGKVIGWFQGRFEMGPRALGNRSILADPRDADMRRRINERIKRREPFRPFAPAVLAEHAAEYFDIRQLDPFMTLAPKIKPCKTHLIPAAVHADGTGRIQTVSKADNPRFHAVISAFAALTGVPVLLNTSFNRQEPIVASPADAISCFQRTRMDALAIGTRYVSARPQQAGRPSV